jgi:cobalt-zinc-cadmium efflux system outer membrane protein
VGLPPNTVLGYSGQQLGSGGVAEQRGLYVGQEFVRLRKLRLNRAVVSKEIQKAEQLWAAQQQRVLTDVRLAYYDVLIAQRRNETTGQLVQIAEDSVKTAEALLRGKELSRVDVMRARVELQMTQLLLKNSRNQYSAAWSRLTAVLGVDELPPRPLIGDVQPDIHDIDAEAVLMQLVRTSPEMAALLCEVERARRQVDRACVESLPNVELQAVVQGDNATDSGNANVQVTFPIPWLDRNQGAIQQARAEVVAAQRAVDRMELELRERLASVYQRYANARNQVQDYAQEGGILANSKATLELVGQGYQAEELSYLDLITAQRTFSQTNLNYIEALGEFWAAAVEIDGLLLKGSLASDGNSSE